MRQKNLTITDDYSSSSALRRRYELLKPILDERLRRLWAAAEALVLGSGGVSILSGATGLSRTTIRAGIEELKNSQPELARLTEEGRVRRRGAGRKSIEEQDETIEQDLVALLESSEDEEGHPLDWTCKSIRGLAEELSTNGRRVSYRTVGNLLHRTGYHFSPSEGYKKYSAENRREQYRLISRRSATFLRNNEPVLTISFLEARQPTAPTAGSAALAASALRYWWHGSGSRMYPKAKEMLLITDTAGLPAGDKEVWAADLQALVTDLGVDIVAAHFPPGARRWRRSLPAFICSCSSPSAGELVEALTVEIDLILLPEGESLKTDFQERDGNGWRSPSTAFSGAGEVFEELWNYRILRRT